MDNALSYITQFNLTRTQIDFFVRKALDEVDAGMHNPLVVHLCLKAMEELVNRIKDGISEAVLVEVEKYPKTFEFMGARFQLSERRTYDFSQDAVWKETSLSLKRREDLLKHLSIPVADADTGEVIQPAQFKITPVITVMLPK